MNRRAAAARVVAALLGSACVRPALAASPKPFPLVRVGDVGLPGAAARFDCQDVGRIFVSSMPDRLVVFDAGRGCFRATVVNARSPD